MVADTASNVDRDSAASIKGVEEVAWLRNIRVADRWVVVEAGWVNAQWSGSSVGWDSIANSNVLLMEGVVTAAILGIPSEDQLVVGWAISWNSVVVGGNWSWSTVIGGGHNFLSHHISALNSGVDWERRVGEGRWSSVVNVDSLNV